MLIFSSVKRRTGKVFSWYKTLSLKKKILVTVGAVVLFFIIGGRVSALTQKPAFTTSKAELGSITEVVTESGNVASMGRVDVYSPANGIVTETYVANGDSVTEGDELFKVESSATEQESQAAYANYLAAVSTLNAAKSNADVLQADMFDKWQTYKDIATNPTYEKDDDTPDIANRTAAEFHIVQNQWVAAEQKYKDQAAVIAQAQALTSSTWNLYQATRDAVVKAPSSGRISNLSIATGGSVAVKSVGLTGATSVPALILSGDGPSEILLHISETDITKVKPGQRATVTISALDNKEYKATVVRVDTIGTDTQGVITYNVYLRLQGIDQNLRQGMTVDANVITRELNNILTVPNSAVKPYQGGRAVRIPDSTTKDKFRYVPVVIGVRGESKTEILKGITPGQEVITAIGNENIKRPGLFGG